MEPFTKLTAVAAPIDMSGVNTDQLFPARFLRKPRSVGYEKFTFHDLRRDKDGHPRADFPLNQDKYADAKILVAGPNFGCGSSREGAVYTLYDSGIRALIAPSYGDIFAANCLKNGILTVRLDDEAVTRLIADLDGADDPSMSIDLDAQALTGPDGREMSFDIDPFQKHCVMNALNEIDLSLEFAPALNDFENAYWSRFPWLASM
jgi:3-isopropylmalate/(R)-2-methylmalate dehydratase small subunit